MNLVKLKDHQEILHQQLFIMANNSNSISNHLLQLECNLLQNLGKLFIKLMW